MFNISTHYYIEQDKCRPKNCPFPLQPNWNLILIVSAKNVDNKTIYMNRKYSVIAMGGRCACACISRCVCEACAHSKKKNHIAYSENQTTKHETGREIERE